LLVFTFGSGDNVLKIKLVGFIFGQKNEKVTDTGVIAAFNMEHAVTNIPLSP
jgi:hypothetical protein